MLGCSANSMEEDEPAAVGTVSPEPTSTPTPTPTPTPAAGTREQPFGVGVVAKYTEASMWRLSVGETVVDAWPEIQAVNSFNAPPAEDHNYASTILTVTTEPDTVPEGADPGGSLAVAYVAAGRSYDAHGCDSVLPAPGSIYETGTMYADATADAYLCAEVPTDDVVGGAWRIGYVGDTSMDIFFQGATG